MRIPVLAQPNVKLHWAKPEGIPNETRILLSKLSVELKMLLFYYCKQRIVLFLFIT